MVAGASRQRHDDFVSVQGKDPGWPFNKLVAAYRRLGQPVDEHHGGLDGAVQAAKGPCPCGQHDTPARDFAFFEYGNGRVRPWSFTRCDLSICLEALDLTFRDLQTGPDGMVIPDDDADLEGPHLAAVPSYPVDTLSGPLADLVSAGTRANLPPALVAGAGLAALATVSGQAELRFYSTWRVRTALWVPLIAPPGAGKTPSIDLARQPIRDLNLAAYQALQQDLAEWKALPPRDRAQAPRPADTTRLIKDITIEMVARWLDRGDGTGGLDLDEMTEFLRSMSRYRQNGGSDVGRWLELWSTEPWRYTRVKDDVDLYIARPVLTLCGGIQPEYLSLLGREGDGMRPRWLPHVYLGHKIKARPGRPPAGWAEAVTTLYHAREPREWALSGEALRTWEQAADRWYEDSAESPAVMAAMAKADRQSTRIALTLAEASDPGAGGEIPVEAMRSAVAITDYALDCWRALPGGESLGFSRRDDAINRAIDQIAEWVERRGGKATKREISRARVAGIRDPARLEEVLRAYNAVYPGSYRAETRDDRAEGQRGCYGMLVLAPRRGNGKSPEPPENPQTRIRETVTGDSFTNTGKESPPGEPARQDVPPESDVPPEAGDSFSGDSFRLGPDTESDHGQAPLTEVLEPFDPGEVTLVRSSADLESALPDVLAAAAVGLDVETTGLDPLIDSVRLLQLAVAGRTYVIDCAAIPGWAQAAQKVVDTSQVLVIHNAMFDLHMLLRAGVSLPADLGSRLRDTMLASRLLEAGNRRPKGWNSLGQVAPRYLGVSIDKSMQTSNWSAELTEEQIRYAAADAAVLQPLRERISTKITRARLRRAAAIENRCLPAMVWLKDSGAAFDSDAHSAALAAIDQEVMELHTRLDETVAQHGAGSGINYASPEQVKEMFGRIGIGLDNTASDTLAAVEHPLARLLLCYRKAAKLQSVYGGPLAKAVAADGRIHANWQQLGSDAGRMSCSDPNLQQVPHAHGFRAMFRAPGGRRLIKADYSQIELRIAAQISRDRRLIEAFRRGEDLHRLTAQEVLGRPDVGRDARQAAKALNFGLLYGMGATRLREHAQQNYGVAMSEQEAAEYRKRFFETYTGLRAWHRSRPDRPVDTRTIGGRRRLGITKFTEKLNSPVQGSGADGLKIAMALLHERKDQAPAGTFPVLTVHDELVIECPAGAADQARSWLVSAMEDGMAEILHEVPVVVDTTVAETWEG